MKFDEDNLRQFVLPFYKEKDPLHNISHIERMLKMAEQLSRKYEINSLLLTSGIYFHGILAQHKKAVEQFLKKQLINKDEIKEIIDISLSSINKLYPATIEQKIAHDAHVLEGGKYFPIIKSLITGTLRHQTFSVSIEHFQNRIKGKLICYLPETIQSLESYMSIIDEMIIDLKSNI